MAPMSIARITARTMKPITEVLSLEDCPELANAAPEGEVFDAAVGKLLPFVEVTERVTGIKLSEFASPIAPVGVLIGGVVAVIISQFWPVCENLN